MANWCALIKGIKYREACFLNNKPNSKNKTSRQ